MHKHFRVLAISEHLRNHGFDPDAYPHTRLSGIWRKLREYYDLDAVNERENQLVPPPDEPGRKRVWKDFSLPAKDYGDLILKRAARSSSEAPSSPPQWDPDAPRDSKKRKRGDRDSAPRARSSTVEDTEGDASAPSPARKPARGVKGRAARASRTKEEVKPESSTSETDPSEAEASDSGDADEEEDEDETGTPASKSGRGGRGRGTGRGRNRGRARGRGRG